MLNDSFCIFGKNTYLCTLKTNKRRKVFRTERFCLQFLYIIDNVRKHIYYIVWLEI